MPKMPLKTALPDDKMLTLRADMLKLLKEYTGELPSDVMLSVAAYTVGQLIALQDHNKFTTEMVMALVTRNIEAGNKQAIESLINQPTAGSA